MLASALDGTTSLTATCSATTPYTIGLDGGNASASDPTQRKMSNSGPVHHGLCRVPAQATPAPGTYSDSIIATLTY